MINQQIIRQLVSASLNEDIGIGDITTNSIVGKSSRSSAFIIVKSEAVICGLEFARVAFKKLDPRIVFKTTYRDGDKVSANTKIATITGKTRALLTAERVALNFLSYLSAIATQTSHYVQAAKPYHPAILDTRKTTPTLRVIERHAVRMGGGVNHRYNLSVMAMIKDNHRCYAKSEMSFKTLVDAIKRKKSIKVELEIDSISELTQALSSGADIILLDNMKPQQIAEAIRIRKKMKSTVPFEASGNINLNNIRSYAKTGVERISIGRLTHSRQAVDISLDFCS